MLKTTDRKRTDYSENDWNVLSEFWHPVAFSNEVGDKPVALTLLDSDLVAYRNADGLVVAANYCPHRGTRLPAYCCSHRPRPSAPWRSGSTTIKPFIRQGMPTSAFGWRVREQMKSK